MKHLLIDHNDAAVHVSPTLAYQDNGNPLVDRGTLAYASVLVKEVVTVADETVPGDLPNGVTDRRYCYIDGEFVPHPNWGPPVEPIDPAYVEALETYALDMAYQLSLYEVLGGGDIA